MSREIKFRAWNNNAMCYVEKILDFKGNMHLILDNPDIDFFGNHYGANTDWAELMQYTGLKDKNDKEIYEDDIVIISTYSYLEPIIDTTCIVEYNERYCIYEFVELDDTSIRYSMSDIIDSFTYELEIIGNIYENPELLGGDK